MMKIARYLGQDGEILEGVVEGDEIEEISGLDAMLKGVRPSEVVVSLPRFKTTVGFDLTKTLASMGMANGG